MSHRPQSDFERFQNQDYGGGNSGGSGYYNNGRGGYRGGGRGGRY
jgi:hypothetical protein